MSTITSPNFKFKRVEQDQMGRITRNNPDFPLKIDESQGIIMVADPGKRIIYACPTPHTGNPEEKIKEYE